MQVVRPTHLAETGAFSILADAIAMTLSDTALAALEEQDKNAAIITDYNYKTKAIIKLLFPNL